MNIEFINPNSLEQLDGIKEIFFETTSIKTFSSEAAKDQFFHKWTDFYLLPQKPGKTLVALEEGVLLGYLTLCMNSAKASWHFNSKIPSYSLFADLFTRFPAHLHINLTSKVRGQGIGSSLIHAACKELLTQNIKGLHIVTAPAARNVTFYRSNQFQFEVERSFKGNDFLFMGRELLT